MRMASEINLSTLQTENPDFLLSAASVAQALQQHHFALLRLVEQDAEMLGMAQTLLKDNVDAINTDKAALQPSKQFPGRDVYEYSVGQNMSTVPLSLQKAAPQVCVLMKSCCPNCGFPSFPCYRGHSLDLAGIPYFEKDSCSCVDSIGKVPTFKDQGK